MSTLPVLAKETKTALESEALKAEVARVLPKGYTPDAYLRTVYTLHLRNPRLFETTLESRRLGIMQAAELGLPLDGTMATLSPYKKQAQLIVMFQGYVQLFYRHPRVAGVQRPVLVYEGDEYEYQEGLKPVIRHVQKPRTTTPKIEELVAAYASVQIKGGARPFVWMWRDELDRRRDMSPAYKAGIGPWIEWPEAMYRKTPMRELAKYVPKSSELILVGTYDEPDPEWERPLGPPYVPSETPVEQILDAIAEPGEAPST